MYFALGLLAAGLLALLVTPAMWRRATRLARARIEATAAMSRAEINAEKDHLRADFAVTNRRLELDVGRLSEKLGGQVLEVNRRRDEIAALVRRQSELNDAIGTLERRVDGLTTSLTAREAELAATRGEVTAHERTLAERAAAIDDLGSRLALSEQRGEEQRLELVARDTSIGNLGDRVVEVTAAATAAAAERDRLASALTQESERLATATKRAEGLEASLAALRAERAERLAELDRRADEVQALKSELAAEQVGREAIVAELRQAREREDAARGEAAAMAAELAGRSEGLAGSDNLDKAIAAIEADKAALTARLAALESDYAALVSENAELRRVAGAEWESDRQENERLRERLHEVASNVVRLTQAMASAHPALIAADDGNGPNRPTTSAPHPQGERPPAAAASPGEAAAPAGEGGTLGERLRALQHIGARH